jgi:hypothetical protein
VESDVAPIPLIRNTRKLVVHTRTPRRRSLPSGRRRQCLYTRQGCLTPDVAAAPVYAERVHQRSPPLTGDFGIPYPGVESVCKHCRMSVLILTDLKLEYSPRGTAHINTTIISPTVTLACKNLPSPKMQHT